MGSITMTLVCLNCLLGIFGRDFRIYLVCLPLVQFEVILRMIWLEFNHVHINYYAKTMRFLEFVEDEDMFVSAKQVRESIRDDAQVLVMLASLEAKYKGVVCDLPVVYDFPEVFPEDISDFPPEREVEFVIDLVPATSPVSMAPYRMSASVLSELKKKLEDFLEKRFIRMSVSPWGALVLLVKKKDGSIRLCIDYR